jgi:hypothetical protein
MFCPLHCSSLYLILFSFQWNVLSCPLLYQVSCPVLCSVEYLVLFIVIPTVLCPVLCSVDCVSCLLFFLVPLLSLFYEMSLFLLTTIPSVLIFCFLVCLVLFTVLPCTLSFSLFCGMSCPVHCYSQCPFPPALWNILSCSLLFLPNLLTLPPSALHC